MTTIVAADPPAAAESVGWPWRVVTGVVGLLDLETGLWALFDPRGWYRSYPGLGHHWVSGQGGAFNDHLVADGAAGFVAVGVVLLAAAVVGKVVATRLAALALLAHSLPHFLFHVRHSSESLRGADVVVGTWGLLVEAVVAVIVVVGARPRGPGRPG